MRFLERVSATASGAIGAFVVLSVIAGILVGLVVAPPITASAAVAADSASAFNALPNSLKVGQLSQASTMYATKGGQEVPIATFYSQDRQEVGWNDVAQVVKNAAVATEDPQFYHHGAVDLFGTARGAVMTALHASAQGGSSITQQYVKNVLVQKCESMTVSQSSSKSVQAKEQAAYQACYQDAAGVSIVRKVQEMSYAVGLEKTYSKNQILLGYLNIALFGGRIYGIQAAAEYYFGVPASALNLQQAATLVAIVNNPDNLRIDRPASTDNGAANGYKLALERRNYVLDRMLANRKISSAEHAKAIGTKIEPKITPLPNGCMSAQQYSAAFFCDYVQHVMVQDPIFGKTPDLRAAFLERGGLKIYTTLNLDQQATAQQAIANYIPATHPALDLGASNVSTEVGTGRIVTMAQSKPFDNTGQPPKGATAVNYNTDYAYGGSEGFQTGSAYKAFDLLEWLKEGHSLYDSIDATHHSFDQSLFHSSNPCNDIGGAPWQVANDESSASYISVINATAQSVNTAFAEMATKLDLCGIKETAQDLLVHGADEKANRYMANPSSVLGTNYIAPLTMATAYAGIANNGVACSPIAIDRIITASGVEQAVPKSACSPHPVDARVAASAILALKRVLQSGGTASMANPDDGVPIFGKTGTTDNSLENWLVTSTSKVAQATWVGNVSGAVALRSLKFTAANGDGTVGGGDVKFMIAKPILASLNAQYGGSAFSTKYVTGSTRSTATPTPGPTSVPTAPTSSSATPGPVLSPTPIPAPTSVLGGGG